MSNKDHSRESFRYRQLAIFSTIVAEVVITPSVIGGLVYVLTRGKSSQVLWTGVGAVFGLVIGFYRVYLISKKMSQGSGIDENG